MIRIVGLHKVLGGRPVLRGVDLDVRAGEVVALVGSSGAGKSVLLQHAVGLQMPDAGDIRIDGRSVVHATAREIGRIRRRIGFVFQDAALLDSLTVRENLRLALDDRACRRNPTYVTDRLCHALDLVRLTHDILDRLPGELSGGMRKRVGIARAIIDGPDILLCDEPTTGLDPRNVAAINQLITACRDALGATGVVVTHDIASLPDIADRVAFLHDGRVTWQGTPARFVAASDATVMAFLRRLPEPAAAPHPAQPFRPEVS